MSITYSDPLLQKIEIFLHKSHEHKIMFCKRYKAENIWDIGIGAVLDLSNTSPRLINICRELYLADNMWFVGDIDVLLKHGISN